MSRVLIIDDEELIRCMLREALEHAGYEIDEAGNGQEGLQHYRAHPADLVMIDIFMPEKNGTETIKELRRDFPRVKIIAMSGNREFRDNVRQLDVQRTLLKPFGLWEVLEAVHALVPVSGATNLPGCTRLDGSDHRNVLF